MLAGMGTPVYGADAAGLAELRYAWVNDPAGSGTKVSFHAVRPTDPDTAGTGNKRCESTLAGDGLWLPWNRDFWYTVAVRTGDWHGTTDTQAIWQWHEGSSVAGLNPMLAAFVRGSRLFIEMRSNSSAELTKASTTYRLLYTDDGWQGNRWTQFTVQARMDSQNHGTSFLRIWRDGVKIVDYSGPVGYLYANPKDYAKNGIYHWTNGNDWDPKVAKREAWFKGPALVLHRSGYTESAVSNLLR